MESLTLTGLLKCNATNAFSSRRAISVSGSFDITHSRLHQIVGHAVSSLISAGVKPGDIVALAFPNTIELVVMLLAVMGASATAAPLDPAYSTEEFEFNLSESRSNLLLTSIEGNEAAKAAALELNISQVTATLPDGDSFISLSAISSDVDAFRTVIKDNHSSDAALFLHTSGKTLTQLDLASHVTNINSFYELTESESDSTVIVQPLCHVHVLLAGLLCSLGAGASVVLPSNGWFSTSTFWSDMNTYNATWYIAVPTIHQAILDRHFIKAELPYPKLRFIRVCSASHEPALVVLLEHAFRAPVLEAYDFGFPADTQSRIKMTLKGKEKAAVSHLPVQLFEHPQATNLQVQGLAKMLLDWVPNLLTGAPSLFHPLIKTFIVIAVCVGVSCLWCGMCLRALGVIPEKLANRFVLIGAPFILYAVFAIIASILPPGLAWISWVCLLACIFIPPVLCYFKVIKKTPNETGSLV